MYFETENRWYSIEIAQDLFDLIVVRRWGGRHNRIHGELRQAVLSQHEATSLAEKYCMQRMRRGYALTTT
ncbi:hypothetical protein [Chitinilyticum aquatile]|uniref:hypothetical protein n=1 Tax=Chitinilyticum aquatile TaxID=362520 RepID=UPI0006860C5C|nr:hypothetical protein [Chitinilyticum aquatile]